MNKVTILVNTSDGFEDCWDPFFKLFTTYWPNCNYEILLNTEFKEYSFEGLKITTAKSNINSPNSRLTWSECLINALYQVKTPIVLYLQEDYFIDGKVNANLIDKMAELMIINQEIKYIGLTDSGNYPPFKSSQINDNLWEVSKFSKYRISTQAGLWSTEILISYLKPEENGWMFEIFGTKRSQKRNDLFLTINRDMHSYESNPIIPYLVTGIIKAKWHQKIPELFQKHNIIMDFSIRGFYKEKLFLFRKIETTKRLLSNPIRLVKNLLS